MTVTIKDIARNANVSHTTVSRALNDSPFISEETKIKIKTIAKELNYVPNYNAKSLVLDKSYNIGVFFSSIDHGTSPSFFYETIKGINSVVRENYNLVVKAIDDNSNLKYINKKRFDGILLMSQSEGDNVFINDVLSEKIPLVVLNREINNNSVVNVLVENKNGAYELVTYLIKKGHKDIAIIEGEKEFKASAERKAGYINALIDNNIIVNKEYLVEGDYAMESGYNCMKQLLNARKLPTAVFCSNDDMAVGAIKAIHEVGLKVPDDISVAGFGGSWLGDYITPALTTERLPICEMSMRGAQELLNCIDDYNCTGKKIYINAKLIERDSVVNL